MHHHRSGAHHGGRRDARVDSEALWDWNLESGRIHFSPSWIALLGCEDHDISGTPEDWLQRVHPEDSAQLVREIEAVRTGDAPDFALRHRLRHKNGTYRWMSCRGTVVRDTAGQAIRLSGSHSDVTVEMVTDRITGLPNRLLLVDRITHSIERSRRYEGFHFAVLVIDVGRPASRRRQAGQAAGDPLLTAVARRLETSLRVPETMLSMRHNDFVARMDGDHFAILLDGLKEIGHAKIVADRMLGEILKPVALGAREVRLSASIGVAVSATGYTKADDVLHDAETALHRAQVLGGSHCEVFDTGILKSEQAELRLEGDFDAALQSREFELYYQPIVSLESNEVLGFEALVRWRHPVLGMIAPIDFLPIAEQTGFIVPLGNWILREACLRLRTWQSELPMAKDLSVSVNLSSVQLDNEALVEEVADALRASGLDASCLVLELTEGIAIANPAAVTTLLMRLRAMGVRISIDDFGTGYSSLAYLQQFPIDVLKLDRSFVRGMVANRDSAAIVASLIGMSQQLGLRVVAEGIEHDDQLAQLRALKCEAGQGDLFARPLDVEQAVDLLKTGLALQPQRRGNANASVRGLEGVPLWMRGRLFLARRRVAVAAAAVALLSSGALLAALIGARPALGSSRLSVVDVKPELTAKASTSPVSLETTAPKGHWSAVPSPPPAIPLPITSGPAPVPSAPPALTATTSLDVVHLHRLGSCHGRLEVSRNGVAFVSLEDDGLTLKYTEFLHALADDTLILKSANKTYRFKAAASGRESGNELRDLADRIARSRQ
jgi:diguanylate cyclase (GGDEF)-like protein/PAS domain S-box-containing protein